MDMAFPIMIYDWFPKPQQQVEFVTTFWQALQDRIADDDKSGITTVLTEAKTVGTIECWFRNYYGCLSTYSWSANFWAQ
jgi:hypothetical protein